MEKMVSVHHVDKEAFLKGNVEHDSEEKVVVFGHSPSYAEVVERVRIALNWTDPNDVLSLEGRHNVGFGMHIRWKIMPLNSELCWSAYKETVAASQDKALELFATKTFDLNRCASEHDVRRPVQNEPPHAHEVYYPTSSPPPMTQHDFSQPTMTEHERSQPSSPIQSDQYEESEEESDASEYDLHKNDIGDVETNCRHEDMDHDIPYN